MIFDFWQIPCCPEITTTLLVGDIFFKIDERSMILLWKGVKCFCCDAPKRFRILPTDFGHPQSISNSFCHLKKALFRWYTFGHIPHSTDGFDSYFILSKISKINFPLQIKNMSKIVVKFTTLKYGDSEAKRIPPKKAFFETTKKMKIGRKGSESFWDMRTETFDTFP